jgi:DNA excision repair protein ERCC-6
VLIVCPATVLRQWVRELRAWYPRLRAVLLHDSGRSPPGVVRPQSRVEVLRRALEVRVRSRR